MADALFRLRHHCVVRNGGRNDVGAADDDCRDVRVAHTDRIVRRSAAALGWYIRGAGGIGKIRSSARGPHLCFYVVAQGTTDTLDAPWISRSRCDLCRTE